MNKISFGIVGLFGILMPGALFLINILIPIIVTHDSSLFPNDAAGYKMDTLIIIVLLLLSFTFGTVLRTLSPRWAEWLYRHFSKWNFYTVLIAYIDSPQRSHFDSIPQNVWDKHYDPSKVEEKRKHWRHMRLFNYAKNYVIAHSERLSREVQTAEGLSRFMASVFWCSLTGIIISVITITFLKNSHSSIEIILYSLFTNILIFVGSARGVGTIREHEVEVVMQSFFCLKGDKLES